ncbi:hypothetical protein B0H19DRAFT_1067501 [Mycena capillaripes]|nr:hypothetical protein B0H19DRAFT_1067501 [Mycena capillaripes]
MSFQCCYTGDGLKKLILSSTLSTRWKFCGVLHVPRVHESRVEPGPVHGFVNSAFAPAPNYIAGLEVAPYAFSNLASAHYGQHITAEEPVKDAVPVSNAVAVWRTLITRACLKFYPDNPQHPTTAATETSQKLGASSFIEQFPNQTSSYVACLSEY